MIAFVLSFEPNYAAAWLACLLANGRGLQAMIERIAHEVHQWIADQLKHGFVDLGFLPVQPFTDPQRNHVLKVTTIGTDGKPGWSMTSLPFCRLAHDGPFVLHPEEIETGDWFSPAEVARWLAERPQDFCPSFKLLWPMVGERLGV